MTFDEIYKRIRPLWPDEIDISDGIDLKEGKFLFPTMNSIYDEIEEGIDHENDHWTNMGVWAFEQSLWVTAKVLFKEGTYKLKVSEVSKELFDKKIKSHLESDDWKKECVEYQGLA